MRLFQTFAEQLKTSKKQKDTPAADEEVEGREKEEDPVLVAEEISRDDLRTGKFQYVTNPGQFCTV